MAITVHFVNFKMPFIGSFDSATLEALIYFVVRNRLKLEGVYVNIERFWWRQTSSSD